MQGCGDGDGGTHSYGSGGRNGSRIGRRECLKLAGVGVASAAGVAAGSDPVRAASDGYGEGGYGEGPYGGDGGFGVATGDATSVDATSATLGGELVGLDRADSAECYFEWRSVGASSWNTRATQTLSATGSFSADVGDLSSGTDYEYRAAVTASDDDTDTGGTASFTTDSGNSAPTVDSYSASEAGSPNPHLEVTADWSVSDADGDLGTVAVVVSDSSGTVVDSASTAVSGGSASGSDECEIKHVAGQTFDVTVTVTDAAGNSDSRTRSVTE